VPISGERGGFDLHLDKMWSEKTFDNQADKGQIGPNFVRIIECIHGYKETISEETRRKIGGLFSSWLLERIASVGLSRVIKKVFSFYNLVLVQFR